MKIYLDLTFPLKCVSGNASSTLGARGFSCAVSGVGHVFVVTREAKRRIFVRCAREKSSGTQGMRAADFAEI